MKSGTRYLKATKDMKIYTIIDPQDCGITLTSWSDSDFAANKTDGKSIAGGVLAINGLIVQWICKRQTGVSLSTMEEEFNSASHVGREMLGLREI